MNLCSDGHDEVCHEGRECPACNHIKDLKETIEEKNRKIEQLESQIEELENQ